MHLKELLARKAPPAGALKLIAEAMARGETQPLMSSFGHETACELLVLTGGGGANVGHRDLLLAELAHATEKRTQVIALAMVLGAAEHGVRDVHTWQNAEGKHYAAYGVPAAARYLAWLAEHTGYELSASRPRSPPTHPAVTSRRARPSRTRPPTGQTPARAEGDSEARLGPRAGARPGPFPPGGHLRAHHRKTRALGGWQERSGR